MAAPSNSQQDDPAEIEKKKKMMADMIAQAGQAFNQPQGGDDGIQQIAGVIKPQQPFFQAQPPMMAGQYQRLRMGL